MSIRQLLEQYGIAPKKGYGQNFLIQPGVLSAIVEAAQLDSTDQVLEVGPGLGVLTKALAKQAGRVVAVELDPKLVTLLREQVVPKAPNVELLQEDILELDIGRIMTEGYPACYKVVANLPYNITSAALRHLLESDPPPERLVVMVQKEVAQRIVAEPGEMSILAVSVQFYGKPEIVSYVSAGSFYPRPKVDSAILRIDTLSRPDLTDQEIEQFFRLVRAGFAQRRKQLHNTLAANLSQSSDQVKSLLRNAGIDPRRRAQTLSVREWIQLSQQWPSHKG
jgi:16S rRNA (adenine1518-N6/adenine1519-N6)-dimethyltransferase